MRGVAVAITLLVLGGALTAGWIASEGRQLFDPALSRNKYPCSQAVEQAFQPLDPSFDRWFGEPLRAVDEPSLFQQAAKSLSTTTIRLTFLPSFSDPVIVRVDDLYGPRPRLTATRYARQIRITDENRVVRPLTESEAASIARYVEDTAVLKLPPDSCLSGVDGVIYLIEAAGPDGYAFINRWGVSDGPVYGLANRLYRLTGWPNGPQGPDRSGDTAAV